jgi:long-chain acyl-CoA synthetase
VKADTLGRVLGTSAHRFGPKTALMHRVDGGFRPISYEDLHRSAQAVAGALAAAGLRPGDRIAIISENRPEWAFVDWGAQLAGIVTVPIYPTLTAPQVAYMLRDSGAKLVFCDGKKQAAKCREAGSDVAHPPEIVSFDAVEGAQSLEEVVARGSPLEEPAPAAPDDVCTIIYTSGTTGDPKGVQLTHRNFLSNIEACLQVFRIDNRDLFLSFLPLSHVFERMAGHYLPIYVGATIAYSKSLRTLQSDIETVRPTAMLVVPRVLEQIQARIQSAAEGRRLFRWALSVGRRRSQARQAGGSAPLFLALIGMITDALAGRAVRQRFGGRLRLPIAGGAALARDTAQFYAAFGINVLQGYGLTETSPVIAVNPEKANRFGTVGRPVPGLEVRIADDGEVLTRGPHVMKGYFNLPEATAEAIDADGWFHTGDVGVLDAEGYLRITDRKKDLLVLANGKNVAPQPIENLLISRPLIDQAVVLGDGQSVVSALIVPSLRAFAERQSTKGLSAEELASSSEVHEAIRAEIDEACKDLADYERVKRFAVLATQFTVEGGELTPTLKIRRKVIREKYRDIITSLTGA